MAKITWLGEDELHDTINSLGQHIPGAGPSFTLWNDVKFPKGIAVDVTNPMAIAKAKGNRFFKVEEDVVHDIAKAVKRKVKIDDHQDKD